MSLIKQSFREIKAEHKRIEKLGEREGASDSDEYWSRRELFKLKLKSFLDSDFSSLTSSMCNTYRPREPWQMMLAFAMLNDDGLITFMGVFDVRYLYRQYALGEIKKRARE